MAWLRMEDTTHSHPAVLAAGIGGDERTVNEVLGWVTRCGSWSAEHLQDGFVPEPIAQQFAGAGRYPVLLRAARRAQLVTRRARRDATGQPGWDLAQGEDAVMHIRTKEEVQIDRERRGTTRKQDAVLQVRRRDGDQCRYCRRTVDFTQRKAERSGTYDHPDPADRNRFVVACRGCNSAKGKRTPEQWAAAGGFELQDPPQAPHYTEKTAAWLADKGVLPQRPDAPLAPDPAPTLAAAAADAHARPGSQPDPAAPGSTPMSTGQAALDPVSAGSASGPDLSASALPRQTPPGRDGSGPGPGRVGSEASDLPPTHSRDGPPRRGRRGRRGRQARAP